jgi:hypothetical protein
MQNTLLSCIKLIKYAPPPTRGNAKWTLYPSAGMRETVSPDCMEAEDDFSGWIPDKNSDFILY